MVKVRCVYACHTGIRVLGFGQEKVPFPLGNNSVYTVHSDYHKNECPLMLCSSDSEQDNEAQWLHLNGSVVTENAELPYYQLQSDDGQYQGAGLWYGSSYILTALDEQELICQVSHPSGVERVFVRVQLPRGETCHLNLPQCVLHESL